MSHMNPSWFRWFQSTRGLYHESHVSVMCQMDPFHLWSLSWVTWIQSTRLLYQESYGSVSSHMDPVHQWSISFVSPGYEPVSSVNNLLTISCSRTPLHGVVFRREADFVVNLVMQWDRVRMEMWPLMGPSPQQMMFEWVGNIVGAINRMAQDNSEVKPV